MKSWRHTLVIGFLALILEVGIFQNCGMAPAFAPMTVDLPMNHPPIEQGSTSEDVVGSKLIIGDRGYLESVFRQVFAPEGTSADIANLVNAVLYDEFNQAQSVLGQPCNPIESGTGATCDGIVLNMKTTPSASSSSVREAARIQVCRRLLENDVVLGSLVSRVAGKDPTPTVASTTAIVRLFYPNEDADEVEEATEKLLTLDQTMAAASERVVDRWRLIVLSMCESPDWQVL